jgi:hypothetical protein
MPYRWLRPALYATKEDDFWQLLDTNFTDCPATVITAGFLRRSMPQLSMLHRG